MTEAPDGPSHVDPEVLADLEEGLLDGAAESTVRTHLAGCARCRADLAALTGVRDLLAGAATVGPTPDDVVARLDGVLAAVAAEPAGSAVTRTVTPLRGPAPAAPRGMRPLQVAAVVVLLLAGSALGFSALRGGGDSSNSAGSASSDANAPKAATGSFPLTASGRDWTAATVTAAAPQLVTGSLAPTVAPDAASPESGGTARELAEVPAARLAGGPALADCVTALADGPVTPLAVDLARFQGRPAAVVVLPGLAGPTKLDVWVVGPDCAQGNDDLLYYASVPRS